MTRYIVERTFPEGLHIPADAEGARTCLNVVGSNAQGGVTWVTSYLSADKSRTYCLYDAATPDDIREAALRSGLPVDRITEVRVLDPYFAY